FSSSISATFTGAVMPTLWSPVGPLRALLPPITLPGGDEARMGDVPALGQHTEALLRAVGMTDDLIAAMRRDGVVA
ncbi:hypothetical protein ACWEN3_41770, partial [Streptomyces sp. NPDC004561]